MLLVVVARSNVVVESTANSVGDPTRSKVIDDALEAGPEQVELLVAVEVTEVNILLACCEFGLLFWLFGFTTTIKCPFSSCICCCCCW